MAVREWGERVIFTHRVEAGASDRSYGIHVARLAGVPQAVVSRAEEILANLERDEFGGDGLPKRARKVGSRGGARAAALCAPRARGSRRRAGVIAEIRGLSPERLTPLEALKLIDGWSRLLNRDGGRNR